MTKPQTLDQLTAGLRTAPDRFTRPSAVAKGAGSFIDLFTVASGFPVQGATPLISGSSYNSASQGAIPIIATPGGKQSWLVGVSGVVQSLLGVTVCDRLIAHGGLLGNSTALQPITGLPLPRATTGDTVMPWLVCYGATGTTATTGSLTYTNEQGVSGRVASVIMPASLIVGQAIPFGLQAGDRGVRSISGFQLASSTGTAGNLAIVLVRELADLSGPAVNADWLDLGLPEVEPDSCLSVIGLANTTSTGTIRLNLKLADV